MNPYPFNQILQSPEKHDLILCRWISEKVPTHLPHLKFILQASEPMRLRALTYTETLISAVKEGGITYPTQRLRKESLERFIAGRKKLSATF